MYNLFEYVMVIHYIENVRDTCVLTVQLVYSYMLNSRGIKSRFSAKTGSYSLLDSDQTF